MRLVDKEFDVLHFHIDLFHFPLFRSVAARTLTTLHGRQEDLIIKPVHSHFAEMPLVSNAQRKPMPLANFRAPDIARLHD